MYTDELLATPANTKAPNSHQTVTLMLIKHEHDFVGGACRTMFSLYELYEHEMRRTGIWTLHWDTISSWPARLASCSLYFRNIVSFPAEADTEKRAVQIQRCLSVRRKYFQIALVHFATQNRATENSSLQLQNKV